jgi:hypothetical protein
MADLLDSLARKLESGIAAGDQVWDELKTQLEAEINVFEESLGTEQKKEVLTRRRRDLLEHKKTREGREMEENTVRMCLLISTYLDYLRVELVLRFGDLRPWQRPTLVNGVDNNKAT